METIGYFFTQSDQNRTICWESLVLLSDFLKTYLPSLYNSLTAGSSAIAICSPALYPAFSMASSITSIASTFDFKDGAKPPSSPTAVLYPRFFNTPFNVWNTSTPQRRASENEGAPTGITMNSWKSTLLSACAPPFRIFIIGVGSVFA